MVDVFAMRPDENRDHFTRSKWPMLGWGIYYDYDVYDVELFSTTPKQFRHEKSLNAADAIDGGGGGGVVDGGSLL